MTDHLTIKYTDGNESNYAAYWDNHARMVGHRAAVTPLTDEEYKALHTEVLRQLAPPKVERMLDYGCGPALLLPIVRERWPGVEYFGVDISQEMLHYCRDHYKEDVRAWFYSVNSSPMDHCASYFEFLTCHSVFTHINLDDAVKLLLELHRLLIPGGVASISILDEPQGGANFEGSLHRVDYDLRFFKGMLVQAGFSVEKVFRDYQCYIGVKKL